MGGLVSSAVDWIQDPLGNQAPKNAVAAQQAATGQANAALGSAYRDQQGYLNPYSSAGLSSLAGMQNPDFQRDFTMSDFQKDPGYDFRMQEGQKAIERSAAARGGLQSGATMKALTQYGQNFASNEYNNVYNRFNADRDRRFGRLSSLTSMGYGAAGQMSNNAGAYGSNLSNNYTGMGNAIAAANLAQGQANQALTSNIISAGSKMYAGK